MRLAQTAAQSRYRLPKKLYLSSCFPSRFRLLPHKIDDSNGKMLSFNHHSRLQQAYEDLARQHHESVLESQELVTNHNRVVTALSVENSRLKRECEIAEQHINQVYRALEAEREERKRERQKIVTEGRNESKSEAFGVGDEDGNEDGSAPTRQHLLSLLSAKDREIQDLKGAILALVGRTEDRFHRTRLEGRICAGQEFNSDPRIEAHR